MGANRTPKTIAGTIQISPARLRIYKSLIFFFGLTSLASLVYIGFDWVQNNATELGLIKIQPTVPQYEKIRKIMEPLRYSALEAINRPEVTLTLNFENRSWILNNIRRFTADGKIMLDEGRYGACGELSAYVFQQIRPLLDHRYSIRLVRVAESSFFPPNSSHYALFIIDSTHPQFPVTYVLDPSFRRYGRIDDFENYRFYETSEKILFVDQRIPYEVFQLGQGAPLIMQRRFLLELVVESIDGKFDKDNFALSVRATSKHNYSGRRALSLRRVDGKFELYENTAFVKEKIESKEYEVLKKRLIELYHTL